MQFRLRYGAHDLELLPGEFVIGRSDECQLSLDDAMVSRRHATLRVSSTGVIAVDLGSRNGVTVNGVALRRERLLRDGDRIKIGQAELVFHAQHTARQERRLSTRTLQAVDVRDIQTTSLRNEPGTREDVARGSTNFLTLALLANKAFAMGRSDEAERILARPLADIARDVGPGHEPPHLEKAAAYALRLAETTGKASWIDWVIDAYDRAEALMPAQLVEDIHGAVRKVPGSRPELLERYLTAMGKRPLKPNERFLLSRIEGLRPLFK